MLHNVCAFHTALQSESNFCYSLSPQAHRFQDLSKNHSENDYQRLLKQTKDGCRKRLHYDSTTVGEGGGRDGGREVEKATSNKPPLSYASLIVLVISSTPQRMLTLSGIYHWIESTFPFYRTPESKAWKVCMLTYLLCRWFDTSLLSHTCHIHNFQRHF